MILTIYSVEEQVGKTMLAVNLGVSLINETQKSVVLVDLSTAGNGMLAGSVLKHYPLHHLHSADWTPASLRQYLQVHSSHLALLTVDSTLLAQEDLAPTLAAKLLQQLGEWFDYIVVDTTPLTNRLTYETIDRSDLVIFLSTSFDHEYPVGMLGQQALRQVVNRGDDEARQTARFRKDCYVLPEDVLAVETAEKGGIPFVIQSPYRPISRMIARLARDLGQKQVGLALTGAAALGLSQLGVLEVFERNRIVVDMLVGTSFGALIGAAYAAGVEFNRFARYVVSWALSRSSFSRLGAYLGKGYCFKEKSLQILCDTFLRDVYFEDLLIPLYVIAFDVRTGKVVIFKEGKVLDAIKVSMRIPGLFAPFKHTERYLVDSSVVAYPSVFPLHQMGANMTIAVHLALPPGEILQHDGLRGGKDRFLTREQKAARQNYSMSLSTFDHLMEQLPDTPANGPSEQRARPDMIITPDTRGISWRDFHRINELMDAGGRAAEALLPTIESLKWGTDAVQRGEQPWI
jgi:NTE family protein